MADRYFLTADGVPQIEQTVLKLPIELPIPRNLNQALILGIIADL